MVTWAYAAMFGVPAVPVAIFLAEQGRLPSLWGLFDTRLSRLSWNLRWRSPARDLP